MLNPQWLLCLVAIIYARKPGCDEQYSDIRFRDINLTYQRVYGVYHWSTGQIQAALQMENLQEVHCQSEGKRSQYTYNHPRCRLINRIKLLVHHGWNQCVILSMGTNHMINLTITISCHWCWISSATLNFWMTKRVSSAGWIASTCWDISSWHLKRVNWTPLQILWEIFFSNKKNKQPTIAG